MNWIKITPETELPKDVFVLAAKIDEFGFSWGKGILWAEGNRTHLDLSRSVILNVTYYCIVTPPNEEQL